jgi:hypothetical protein
MIRVIIGAVAAAIAMFIIGFLFFATPLAKLGMANLDDVQAAGVQQAMAANLPRTGTYSIPSMDTQAQTNMFSRGPIATVHYNTDGFAATDPTSLVMGLVLNFLVALLIGAALIGIDRRVGDYGSRARAGVIIALAATAFIRLGEPIYWHHDWGHFLYLLVADGTALAVAAIVVAWFLPREGVTAEAPEEV